MKPNCVEGTQTNGQEAVTLHTVLPRNRASGSFIKGSECRKLKPADDFQTSSSAVISTSPLIPLHFHFFFFLLRQGLLTREKWTDLNVIFFNFLGAG